jgi:hypothetical protein
MSGENDKEHISFGLNKKDILPPLQKRIVTHLAKTKPSTINETVKAMKGQYKSCWLAFNALEEKHVIKKIDIKSYHGQEYPLFWLTPSGVLIALFEGVSHEVLLEKILQIYPDDKNLQIILEFSPIFGLEVFKIAFLTLQDRGKFDMENIMMMVSIVAKNDFNGKPTEDIIAILKKNPESYENAKKYAKTAFENIKKLNTLFK